MCIIVPKNKGIYSKRNEEELKIFGLRTTVYINIAQIKETINYSSWY